MRALCKLLQGLVFAAVLGVAGTAAAQSAVNVTIRKDALITQFTSSALNGAGKWTGWIEVSTWRSIVFEINYTWSSATAVTMRCETTDDPTIANDAGFDLHILSDSTTVGTSDSSTHTWSNAVSASEKWTWTVANLPHEYINCLFGLSGGGAGDVAVVKRKRISP